jgi:hypothetical protein
MTMFDPTDTDAGSELDAPMYELVWRNKHLGDGAQTHVTCGRPIWNPDVAEAWLAGLSR